MHYYCNAHFIKLEFYNFRIIAINSKVERDLKVLCKGPILRKLRMLQEKCMRTRVNSINNNNSNGGDKAAPIKFNASRKCSHSNIIDKHLMRKSSLRGI